MNHETEETKMTTHPADPLDANRQSDNPRLAILSRLHTPPYDAASGTYCTPLDEAAQLLDAHRAAVLCEGAETVAALDRRKTVIHADTIRDAWEEGRDEGADLLRDMAGGRSDGAYRAAELRDFLWRLAQSSGDAVAAKLVEDNPDLAELLNATETGASS